MATSSETGSQGAAFRCLGINHVGLAPKDPARAQWFFGTALGLPSLGDELVAEQQVLTAMFGTVTGDQPPQHSRLEVLKPEPEGAGAIGKFLEKKGSGVHHVAVGVKGLVALISHLESLGVRMIDRTPRPGAHHTRIAFVHPESTGGLLVELVEEAGS